LITGVCFPFLLDLKKILAAAMLSKGVLIVSNSLSSVNSGSLTLIYKLLLK